MSTPLIGITTNPVKSKISGQRNALSVAYSDAVRQAGAMPVMIPNEFPLENLNELLKKLNGVILSGGGDIQTSRFQGIESFEVDEVSSDRDELEIQLVHQALQLDLPLLGICRGVQIMNVALGGTLYTHIPDQFKTALEHQTSPTARPRNYLAHKVTVEPESRLFSILQKPEIHVNSRHHQAVKDPAASVVVSAHASDGLIEGLEVPGKRFALGVQWHPENLQEYAEQRALFAAFVRAALV